MNRGLSSLAVLVAVTLSGCISFLFTDGPEPRPGLRGTINDSPREEPLCTMTFGTVYVDAAYALVWIPLAVLTDESREGVGWHEVAVTGALVSGTLSAISAIVGARDVVRCRREQHRWRVAHPDEPSIYTD